MFLGGHKVAKNTQMVITRVIWGPPGLYFGMHLSTILSNICLSPKVFVKKKQFLRFLGGHKSAKILYIAIYIYSSLYIAIYSYIIIKIKYLWA